MAPNGYWVDYWTEDELGHTTVNSNSSQTHWWSFITMHPIVVGPILYCFYILWTTAKDKRHSYFYHAVGEYNGAVLDWLSNYAEGPPPVVGDLVWENDFPDPTEEDYSMVSVLVKACVYTEESLEKAKEEALKASASGARIYCRENQKNTAANRGYNALDWLPGAPGKMQKQLTSLWLNRLYYDDLLYVADKISEQKIMTRPHTKAELQEAGMWPKEA
jgi:hypothetical protein